MTWYREIAPHPALERYVDRFWVSTEAQPPAGGPGRVLPDGCIDLLVPIGGGEVFAVGALRRPLVIAEPVCTAAVRFRPGGAAPFLHVAGEELTDRRATASELGKPWLQTQALLDATSAERAVAILERCMLERLRLAPVSQPHAAVAHAVTALLRAAPPSIDLLARELDCSRQHLTRRFRHEVGIGPKEFGRIARLQHAVDRLQRLQGSDGGGSGPGLADLALDLGYFDQAHMNRDFRELAGITPAQASRSAGSIFPIRSLLFGA